MIIKFMLFRPDGSSNMFKDIYNEIDNCFYSINKNAFSGANTLKFDRISDNDMNIYLHTSTDDLDIIRLCSIEFVCRAKKYFECDLRELVRSAMFPTVNLNLPKDSNLYDCDMAVKIPTISSPFIINKYAYKPKAKDKLFSVRGFIKTPDERGRDVKIDINDYKYCHDIINACISTIFCFHKRSSIPKYYLDIEDYKYIIRTLSFQSYQIKDDINNIDRFCIKLERDGIVFDIEIEERKENTWLH